MAGAYDVYVIFNRFLYNIRGEKGEILFNFIVVVVVEVRYFKPDNRSKIEKGFLSLLSTLLNRVPLNKRPIVLLKRPFGFNQAGSYRCH